MRMKKILNVTVREEDGKYETVIQAGGEFSTLIIPEIAKYY